MRAHFKKLSMGVAGLCLMGQPALAASDDAIAKVGMLLSTSGYAYKTIDNGVWTIGFAAPPLGDFKLLAGVDNGLLTGFVVVAKAGQFMPTTELMSRLLHLDTTLDTVRVGLDADGDLVVETKLPVRTLDGDELKNKFDEIAAAANSVYTAIAPALVRR